MASGIFWGYTGDKEVQYLIYTPTTRKEKFWPPFPSLISVKREPLISANWQAVKHTKQVADQPIQ